MPMMITKESREHIVELLSRDSKTEVKANASSNPSSLNAYNNESLIIDTCAMNHLSSRSNWLLNLKSKSSRVHLPNGGYSSVESILC